MKTVSMILRYILDTYISKNDNVILEPNVLKEPPLQNPSGSLPLSYYSSLHLHGHPGARLDLKLAPLCTNLGAELTVR